MSMNGNAADSGTSVASPGIKLITAWLAALGITSWGDLASFLAAVYTACLLSEWVWKRFLRPLAERRGWVRRLYRRKDDQQP